MGLYTPTILGGNSYLSWFYDRGAIKDPAHTGSNKGLSQAIKRGPRGKFLPKYGNVYVTVQSHALSAGARTHYVTANGVRGGLYPPLPCPISHACALPPLITTNRGRHREAVVGYKQLPCWSDPNTELTAVQVNMASQRAP